MVELMLNMYVCYILSHDVSKFVCFIPQLRFLITVKSGSIKGFYHNLTCIIASNIALKRAQQQKSFFPVKHNKSVILLKMIKHALRVVEFATFRYNVIL